MAAADFDRRVVSSRQITPATSPSLRLQIAAEGQGSGPAIAAEDLFKFSALNPAMGSTIRRLANWAPRTLALMHGPSFSGNGAATLNALADDYDRRIGAALVDAGLPRPGRTGSAKRTVEAA